MNCAFERGPTLIGETTTSKRRTNSEVKNSGDEVKEYK